MSTDTLKATDIIPLITATGSFPDGLLKADGNRILPAGSVTPADVGFENINDTSDMDKPVSTAQQAALDGKLSLTGGVMSGQITLPFNPSSSMHTATKQYVDTMGASKLPLSGGNLSGPLLLHADPTNVLHAATKQYVDSAVAGGTTTPPDLSAYLQKSGGVMTGPITLSADPVSAMHAASKQYVDNATSGTTVYTSILDHGGDSTGTSYNDSAFTAAWNALGTRGGIIYFPPGRYLFASKVDKTLPNTRFSVKIMGAGDGTTELRWMNADGGMKFTYTADTLANILRFNNMTFSDMTFATDVANGGYGIFLKFTASSTSNYDVFPIHTIIQNMTFCGTDMGYSSTKYWSQCNRIEGVNMVKWSNCIFHGAISASDGSTSGQGVSLQGSGDQYAVLFDFTRCLWNHCNYGLIYGPGVQGVTVSQCNFNGEGGTAGIITSPTTGYTNGLQAQLFVTASQFDNGLYGIWAQGTVYNIACTNCTFTVSKNNGKSIYNQAASMMQLSGNSFQTFGSVTGCMGVHSIGQDTTIVGNSFLSSFAYNVNLDGSGPHSVMGNTFRAGEIGVNVNGEGNCTIIGNIFGPMTSYGYVWQSGTNRCQGMGNSWNPGLSPSNRAINWGSSIAPGTGAADSHP